MYKSFNNFHLVFFFWEQCEKSDRDCLVKQDAHSFFVDARGFSVGVHKLIAMITMQINPSSFHCNFFFSRNNSAL